MDESVTNVDLVWPARPNFSLPLIKFKVHGYSGPGLLGDVMAYAFFVPKLFPLVSFGGNIFTSLVHRLLADTGL